MKKSIIVLVFLFINVFNVHSQSDNIDLSRFAFTGEVSYMRSGGMASLNVDYLLTNPKSYNFQAYARFGYAKGGYFKTICNSTELTGILGGVTLLLGTGNHHFEMNAGAYYVTEDNSESTGVFACGDGISENIILPLVKAGYRFQRPNGGVIFNLKIGTRGLGLGLGYAF